MASYSLESILNFTIPTAVILIFVAVIYWKLKEPIDAMFRLIGRGLNMLLESVMSSLSSNPTTEITYK